jgi:hypothetical protein
MDDIENVSSSSNDSFYDLTITDVLENEICFSHEMKIQKRNILLVLKEFFRKGLKKPYWDQIMIDVQRRLVLEDDLKLTLGRMGAIAELFYEDHLSIYDDMDDKVHLGFSTHFQTSDWFDSVKPYFDNYELHFLNLEYNFMLKLFIDVIKSM